MKKLFTVILILPLLFFCGFFKKEKRPFLVLSSGAITTQTTYRIERNFASGQRINYALIAPSGFKKSGVRLQLSKQDDKTTNWGFSIVKTQDLYLVKGETSYRNYIYLKNPGRYILQFFYLSNKDYPFAHIEFRVQ